MRQMFVVLMLVQFYCYTKYRLGGNAAIFAATLVSASPVTVCCIS